MKNRFPPAPSEPVKVELEGSKPNEISSANAASRWPEPKEPLAKTMADNANRMKIDKAFRDEIANKIF
jgi:hypothetical protein